MFDLTETFYIAQWIELFAGIPLVLVSILLVRERAKEDLNPIGFLLFAIAADLLTGHLFFIIKYIPDSTLENQLILFVKSTAVSILSIGVSLNIVFVELHSFGI